MMANNESPAPIRHPSLIEAFWVWVKIGLLSFGGPTGQIALMQQELVEKRKWISDARFLHALNYCMVLPGPEAHQLAIYIGWLLHRTLGGIIAGLWFVLPGAAVLLLISWVYVVHGDIPLLQSIFYGLKAAVLGIVAAAVIRIGKKSLKNEVMWGISALAFVSIFWLKVPFPLIIASAGIIGLAGGRLFPSKFNLAPGHGGGAHQGGEALISDTEALPHSRPSTRRTVVAAVICLAIWFAPLLAVWLWLGAGHTLFREAVFFSKAAVVTFGGAYAVLPYVAQQAVETHQWLSTTQMMDGLGLAETTPGPLILVLQFVGFLGGWNGPGGLPPLLAATLGAVLTSWMTFTPGFLFIFAGAPYIEAMRGNLRMTTALSAITAAVVGVILNLAVWFGLTVLLPSPGRIDWFALVLGAGVFVGLVRFKWDVIPVILGSALLGVIYRL